MGRSFSIVQDKVLNNCSEIKQISGVLKNHSESINTISSQLHISSSANAAIKSSLRKSSSEIMKEGTNINELGEALNEIVNLYNRTELKITSNEANNTDNVVKKTVKKDESPYDNKGGYGGNQGSPRNHKEEMRNIVQKYYPDFTDAQIDDYLEKLNSEGCGYVAICNTVFLQFIGKEKEFEKKFGFPMYKKNGDFNYDAMVTDFYCATDNHNQKGILWWKHDSVDAKEDQSTKEGSGTNRDSRKYRYEMYMKDHGIDVEVKNVKVSPKNFNSVSQKGEVVVGISPCVLYDKNGNKVVDLDGGHAMTVTGVTADGMLIVSSWGEKYYIKPGSYKREQYQQVIYK